MAINYTALQGLINAGKMPGTGLYDMQQGQNAVDFNNAIANDSLGMYEDVGSMNPMFSRYDRVLAANGAGFPQVGYAHALIGHGPGANVPGGGAADPSTATEDDSNPDWNNWDLGSRQAAIRKQQPPLSIQGLGGTTGS